VENLADIPSVAKDFTFFVQENYKIAADYRGVATQKTLGQPGFLTAC
jgi:hypothetical protein